MSKPATPPVYHTHLDSLTHCANCQASMTPVEDDYVCPTNTSPGPASCPTTPVNIETFAHLVATTLLNRIVDETTIDLVAQDVQEIARNNSALQRQRLHRSESSVAELSLLLEKLLHSVEHGLTTYQQVAEEIHRTNAAKMGLAYESQIAQLELDKLAFIGDPQGIREDAREMNTYLKHIESAEIAELVNIFVRDIQVGPESAKMFYSHPLVDELVRPSVTSELIRLDHQPDRE